MVPTADTDIIIPVASPNAGKIPVEVQRAVGKQLSVLLRALQKKYGTTEEDSLMILLALTHGYATAGGLTTDQLSTLAFNVWQIHGRVPTPKE